MSTLHYDSTLSPFSGRNHLPGQQQQQRQQRSHQHTLPPLQPLPSQQEVHLPLGHAQTPPTQQAANEPAGRIIFTRQLWQRSMPDGNHSEQRVLNRSQARDQNSDIVVSGARNSSRRTSSTVSSQRSSQRRHSSSLSPSGADAKTPLTPEESPPFSRTALTTRKRTAGIVEDEDKDKELDGAEGSSISGPLHSRQGSGDSGVHVCICQPDPKIPRPRNAFILYRQHHQASVIAQNPGLANPEISKIIGEQWQNQAPEVKNKWKALAEEEKIRHQQQYPTYRYQPKRSGRRNSISSETGEKPRCQKCGGRSILAPSTRYTNINTGPHTPSSATTPISRTLPVLRDLSLQSPAARRTGKQFPIHSMSPNHHLDEKGDLEPLSPDLKRRRFNGDPLAQLTRAMPPRYVNAPVGPPIQPGTPLPFSQAPPHPYPPGANHARRESLPGLRGMVSPPGPMGPPPRPGPGYQQHRLSQGHVPHDHSLTLPPLQTGSNGNMTPALATGGLGKTAKEQIMNMDFRSKVHVLRRVAPPVPFEKTAPRGPLLVIEGDNLDAVKDLGSWLAETLRKGDDLSVSLLDGPKLSPEGGKEAIMAQYHRLAAEWLDKSSVIRTSLAMRVMCPTDSTMLDGRVAAPASRKASTREIDENYDESDDSSPGTRQRVKAGPDADDSEESRRISSTSSAEKMDVDTTSDCPSAKGSTAASSAKPVSIIASYSLHASNFFACKIPIDAHDPYAPNDHWQWTATQWRGIISPDLTIYVRDALAGDTGKQSVDILDEGNLFVVKRTKGDGKETLEVAPSTLRRLGFEVSEWVRAFGSAAK